MNYKIHILIFLLILSINVCSQTGEFDYFYHSYLFDSLTISENNIRRISVNRYQRSQAYDNVFKQQVNQYQFNKYSKLVCSESRYYSFTDSIRPTQQTTDCFEYSEQGVMIEHRRYHENRDSASWIQKFSYEFNESGLISKIIVHDISYPANSNVTMKFYDTENRLAKETTDFDYLNEYKYDENGNLIEEAWGPKDQQEVVKYYYNSRGNRIRTVFLNDFELFEYTREYDNLNRRIKQEEIYRNDKRSISKYFYSDDLIRTEYFDQQGNLVGEEKQIYKNSIIQSIIQLSDNKIISKEDFIYEFF